jgi:hypothetical protein
MSGHFGWGFFGVGVMQMVTACFGNRLRYSPTVPTEFVVSEDGIAVAVRGSASARTYPWKSVRKAINDKHFITVIVGMNNVPPFPRAVAVPKPDDAALCDAIWTTLYAHMVAPRGLRATPVDRLGVIRNTAFA